MEEIEKQLKAHPFITPWYFQPYQKQTLLSHLLPYFKTKLPKAERKLIKLPDGSQIAADCIFQPNKEDHETIVIIDGFSGSSKSFYSLSMAHKAYHFGFNVILLMERAHGDTIHLTKSIYSGPLDDDINVALDEFGKWNLKKLYIIGLSYGGYLTLSAIIRSEKANRQKIAGAVVISPVINMDYTYHLQQFPLSHKLLLMIFKAMVKRRIKIDPPGTWDTKALKKIKTVRDWYKTYMHTWGYPEKFSSFEEYEKISDIFPFLSDIKTPTLIINAYDDTISPTIPFTKLKNPNIITLLSETGGHGGFFTFNPKYGDLDGHWAQNRAMEFIKLIANNNYFHPSTI